MILELEISQPAWSTTIACFTTTYILYGRAHNVTVNTLSSLHTEHGTNKHVAHLVYFLNCNDVIVDPHVICVGCHVSFALNVVVSYVSCDWESIIYSREKVSLSFFCSIATYLSIIFK